MLSDCNTFSIWQRSVLTGRAFPQEQLIFQYNLHAETIFTAREKKMGKSHKWEGKSFSVLVSHSTHTQRNSKIFLFRKIHPKFFLVFGYVRVCVRGTFLSGQECDMGVCSSGARCGWRCCCPAVCSNKSTLVTAATAAEKITTTTSVTGINAMLLSPFLSLSHRCFFL